VFEESQILDLLSTNVSERVSAKVHESLSSIIQDEIAKALTRALQEGHFYRALNSQVTDSIETVYSEIRAVKRLISKEAHQDSAGLLGETDSILDGIVKSTEKATLRIMDLLEELQSEFKEMGSLLDRGEGAHCREKLRGLEEVVMSIMTELSFQDLTGQQIKKVIQLLKRIEELSFDAYVTSEVFKKSREQAPDKSIDDIREKSRAIVEDARTQKDRIDQEGVDSMLEQLGM
jgi:chemotaxis protein CheZ